MILKCRGKVLAGPALAVALVACSSSSHPAAPKPEPGLSADLARVYAAGLSKPVADPYYPEHGSPTIDVLHYGLDLTWAPGHKALSGTATLAVRATTGTETVRLDFGAPLSVDAATVDGRTVHPEHQGDVLRVPAGRRLARGTTVGVVIKYHGTPQSVKGPAERPDTQHLGFRIGQDGSAVALQEPFGAFTWYPVNDQPSDKALYDVAITVPQGWSGVSSGTFEGKTGETYHWKSAVPMASYLVTFAADRFEMIRGTGPNRLPLTYWVRPKDKAANLAVLRRTPQILAWLEQYLGPFPFPSAGAVIAGDSGMETQQMITVMTGLPDHVFAHEYTHQWFGDSVTPTTWPDLWLNEGFAEYFEWLYEARNLTGAAFDAFIGQVTTQADGQLRKRYGPPGHFNKNMFASGNVYYSPALMLHKIRKKVGDAKFFAMLRGWVQQHAGTSQDRASFTAFASRSTGVDLKPLIDRWLDSTTTPKGL
jgi:aminopeptidase N